MNKNYNYFLNYLMKNKDTANSKVLDDFDAYGVDINHTKNNKKYLDNKLVEKNKLKLITEKDTLPFEDKYFDFIVSNMVFEHFFNIELAASEIFRVLKNVGISYFRFPSYEIIR